MGECTAFAFIFTFLEGLATEKDEKRRHASVKGAVNSLLGKEGKSLSTFPLSFSHFLCIVIKDSILFLQTKRHKQKDAHTHISTFQSELH